MSDYTALRAAIAAGNALTEDAILAAAAFVSAADPATIAALLAELDEARRDAERYRFLRAVYNIPISTQAARDPVVYDAAIDAAMKCAESGK